ncbi:hypothetical protein BIW11_06366 [Tropilaelaps mercedesae]|uniref:Uncharacterized protein n=1 Tax=Tropilaelaps mercedesae TaxID=418985 RepID=A0A1V9XYC1_9ACAR|nr:hypothetical protein BIW11_06366 [Tropilaelaps mercedesae]
MLSAVLLDDYTITLRLVARWCACIRGDHCDRVASALYRKRETGVARSPASCRRSTGNCPRGLVRFRAPVRLSQSGRLANVRQGGGYWRNDPGECGGLFGHPAEGPTNHFSRPEDRGGKEFDSGR